jgi:hypothetical protein
MPSFKVHKKVGRIVSLILSIVLIALFHNSLQINDWKLFLIPLVIIIYSQLPDLDSYTSRIRKKTLQVIFWTMLLSGIISFFVSIELMIALLMLTGLLGLGLLKVSHRGILHTYWFVLLASLPLLFLHWFLFVIALTCSFLHIFIDRIYSKLKKWLKKVFHMKGVTHKHVFVFKW